MPKAVDENTPITCPRRTRPGEGRGAVLPAPTRTARAGGPAPPPDLTPDPAPQLAPKAIREPTPTRRPRGKATAAAIAPDAALLALCAAFQRHQVDLDAWNAGQLPEEEGEAANLNWWATLRQIIPTSATTMAGIRAKAAVLRHVAVTVGTEIDGDLAIALADDIAALAEPNTPNPELLTLLGRFEVLEWKYLDQFKGEDYPELDRRRDRLFARIHAEQGDIADAIVDFKATTLIEFQALARATIIWAPEEVEPSEHHSLHERVGRVLLRSLAGDEWMERLFKALGRPERRAISVEDNCHAGEEAR